MRKKILSVLVSSIVLLYVAGCSKNDGKIGLNINPEPSKPVVDLANDKSSDTKPEPAKAVVEKKEEAREVEKPKVPVDQPVKVEERVRQENQEAQQSATAQAAKTESKSDVKPEESKPESKLEATPTPTATPKVNPTKKPMSKFDKLASYCKGSDDDIQDIDRIMVIVNVILCTVYIVKGVSFCLTFI